MACSQSSHRQYLPWNAGTLCPDSFNNVEKDVQGLKPKLSQAFKMILFVLIFKETKKMCG